MFYTSKFEELVADRKAIEAMSLEQQVAIAFDESEVPSFLRTQYPEMIQVEESIYIESPAAERRNEMKRKWWHGKGRYLLLLMVFSSLLYSACCWVKKTEAKSYYPKYHLWMNDLCSDKEFYDLKKQLWFY